MPSFSAVSLSKLSGVHSDLQTLFNEVIKTWDCSIVTGSRSLSDEQKAIELGLSKLKNPYDSKHVVGPNRPIAEAVDAAPYPVNWDKKGYDKDCILFAGYVLGIAQKLLEQGKITHKIRYGGDWNRNQEVSDETFLDLDHFEIDA